VAGKVLGAAGGLGVIDGKLTDSQAVTLTGALLGRAAVRSAAANNLAGSPEGRTAIGDALKGSDAFTGAVLDRVVAMPARLPVVAETLPGPPPCAAAEAHNVAGGLVVTPADLADARAVTLTGSLLGRAAVRSAAAGNLAGSPEGRTAIGDAL